MAPPGGAAAVADPGAARQPHTDQPGTDQPGASVVRAHRREVAELRDLITLVQADLRRLLAGEEAAPGLLGGRESIVDAIDKLARALDRLITLERRVFDLDSPAKRSLSLEAVDQEIARLETELGEAGDA